MPSDRAQLWRDLNAAGDRELDRAENVSDIDSVAILSDSEAKAFAERIDTCL